jgi:hypothetical protein
MMSVITAVLVESRSVTYLGIDCASHASVIGSSRTQTLDLLLERQIPLDEVCQLSVRLG